jgi:hypothetical protein
MKKHLYLAAAVCLYTVGNAQATPYFGYNDWGGTWHDADKTPSNTEDDIMCWAATTANILAWTGWGYPAGQSFSNEDDIFAYFQDHWTDDSGLHYGFEWWFNGIDNSLDYPGWSHVDVPGGGFYPDKTWTDYFAFSADRATAIPTIQNFLENGYGVGLELRSSTMGHAVTAWGYEYGEYGFTGIYITDSDDDLVSDTPPDTLVYYDVIFSEEENTWYLQDFWGDVNDIYINEVMGFKTTAAVPEPSTFVLTAIGIACCLFLKKRASYV